MLMVSQLFLWVAVVLLGLAVFALARQVGVLHERIAPVGALRLGQDIKVGAPAPIVSTHALNGEGLTVGGSLPNNKKTQLLFFVSPTCPVCKQLLPTLMRFVRDESLDLVVVGDGEISAQRKLASDHAIPEGRFVNGPEVGQAFSVGKLPYAVIIGPAGTILAHGLVNTREHLESLVTAQGSQYETVQEYLAARSKSDTREKKEMSAHG